MSTIHQTQKNIEAAVTGGYKKLEDRVVNIYQKLESAVVGGYQNVEDRFVAAFLAHEGESLAEAKARVRREAKQSAASAGNGRKHS